MATGTTVLGYSNPRGFGKSPARFWTLLGCSAGSVALSGSLWLASLTLDPADKDLHRSLMGLAAHLSLLAGCIVMAARFGEIQKPLRLLLAILPALALLATDMLACAQILLMVAASC